MTTTKVKEETKTDFSTAKKAAEMEEKPWWEKTGEEEVEKEVISFCFEIFKKCSLRQ